MSQHIFRHEFNQNDLDKLIENRLSFYQSTEATGSRLGAVEYVSIDTPVQMLQAFAGKVAQGYTLHESSPVNAYTQNGVGFYSFYMVKPAHMQEVDIEAICAEVTNEYNQHRRELFESHKAAIIEESLQRERNAAAKKAAEAEAKLIAKLEQQALEALGDFV